MQIVKYYMRAAIPIEADETTLAEHYPQPKLSEEEGQAKQSVSGFIPLVQSIVCWPSDGPQDIKPM